MNARTVARVCVLGLLATACADPLLSGPGSLDTDLPGPVLAELPELSAPCALDEGGGTLIVTTTDFSTGSITVVDVRNRSIARDVALSTTDAIPRGVDGRLFLVHRLRHDFIDVLHPPSWQSLGQHALSTPDQRGPNPHSLAIADDGLAYVPLFDAGSVRVLDLSRPPGSSYEADIDLSAFADADGNPEPSLAVACGSVVFVSIQRLDPRFEVVGPDALVPIDIGTRTPVDVDPDRPGGQGIALQGTWLRQLRRDPADLTGHTLLGLTEGIERIELETGIVSWVVPPEALAAVGARHFMLPVAFAVHPSGTTAYVASYGPDDPTVDCDVDRPRCFERATLYEVDLTETDAPLVEFATDFDFVDRAIELVGTELWVGSRRTGSAGLWVYDVSHSPPRFVEGPLSTGLAPYSMTAMEVR
jgi:hypothetical protein